MPIEEDEDVQRFKQDSLLEFLSEAIAYAHTKGKKNALCVLPLRGHQHGTGNWERMASIAHFGLSGGVRISTGRYAELSTLDIKSKPSWSVNPESRSNKSMSSKSLGVSSGIAIHRISNDVPKILSKRSASVLFLFATSTVFILTPIVWF
jgi:hypothetical protein